MCTYLKALICSYSRFLIASTASSRMLVLNDNNFITYLFQIFEHTIFRTQNISHTWPSDQFTIEQTTLGLVTLNHGCQRYDPVQNRWQWHVEHDLLAVRTFLIDAVSHGCARPVCLPLISWVLCFPLR